MTFFEPLWSLKDFEFVLQLEKSLISTSATVFDVLWMNENKEIYPKLDKSLITKVNTLLPLLLTDHITFLL